MTAGIDFGLTLAGEIADEATAQAIQLYMEYNPEPPFQAGSPDTAPASVLEAFRAASDRMIKDRSATVKRAAARLAAGE